MSDRADLRAILLEVRHTHRAPSPAALRRGILVEQQVMLLLYSVNANHRRLRFASKTAVNTRSFDRFYPCDRQKTESGISV